MGVQSEAKAVCSATVETRVKNQTPITAFLFGHRFTFHLSFLKTCVEYRIIELKLTRRISAMTIQDAIANYKSHFAANWEDEKYKWVAVQHFREKWNIEADNFAEMLADAYGEAANLLSGAMYYPLRMICAFAQRDPEKMRGLFRLLYNEELPLVERLQPFRDGCNEMLKELRESGPEYEKAKNHYQDLRALCVYLSFKYPEKYFLYKSRMYTSFRKLIGYKETSTEKDSEIRKYDNFAQMCQTVLEAIKADKDLQQMQRAQVESDSKCYSDPEFHLLAQTIIYVSKETDAEKNPPVEYAMGDEDLMPHYWIYSPGDNASIWNECYTKGIMAIGWDKIGDLRTYGSKNEMKDAMKEEIDPSYPYTNAAHATWQFLNDMKPGDIVFAKKGVHLVIGRGIVESEYQYDPDRKRYKNIRKVKWTHKGEWPYPGQAAMKVLTDITAYTDYVEKLNALFETGTVIEEETKEIDTPEYTAEDFLEDVYMDEASYETLVSLIRKKKNVILQGAPGVGKTYAAKRLAYSMMGEKDAERVMMVQFHQSYSYEDFIMGFRPSEKGFELKHGAFYTFCKKAEEDSDNEYFFIIDEINRGNLSKIFGELFMLIESDKRGVELRLLYANEKFSVPANVYIIGMMNTADRSLALLDYALRRRFAFFEMQPGFETEGFRAYRMALQSERFDKLILCVENLNNAIAADESLGEGFRIGHSYFCNLKEADEQTLSNIVEYELIPLLKEYWFDEPTKVKDWANILRSAIK